MLFSVTGSRPSEHARHESKLDQTHILVRDILYLRRHARLAPKKEKVAVNSSKGNCPGPTACLSVHPSLRGPT